MPAKKRASKTSLLNSKSVRLRGVSLNRRSFSQERKSFSIVSSVQSYSSLMYGVLTVLLLAAIVFLGFKFLPQLPKNFLAPKEESVTQQAVKTQEPTTTKSYTVAEGDNLWIISEKYYGSGYNWVDIAKANNISDPNIISADTRLVIPNIAPKSPDKSITVTAATTQNVMGESIVGEKIEGGQYTVQKNDNLWMIAVRAYGDGYKWVEIARTNNLSNPDLIHSGNSLIIPR